MAASLAYGLPRGSWLATVWNKSWPDPEFWCVDSFSNHTCGAGVGTSHVTCLTNMVPVCSAAAYNPTMWTWQLCQKFNYDKVNATVNLAQFCLFAIISSRHFLQSCIWDNSELEIPGIEFILSKHVLYHCVIKIPYSSTVVVPIF